MAKIISRYVAGIERDFSLDMATGQRIEEVIGSLLSFSQRLATADVKLKEITAILFHSRVVKDKATYESFSLGVYKEGYFNYIQLVGELVADFFHPVAGEAAAEEQSSKSLLSE
jgi:hypothetical protein